MKFLLKERGSPTVFINKAWNMLNRFPCGNRIFSRIIWKFIPYTGSTYPIVEKIEGSVASVRLKDRKAIRNHLNSVHAIALANLGEFTTGLAVISQLTGKAQAILIKIEVEYFKKARGDVIAETDFPVPNNIIQDTDLKVPATIKNSQNEVVCQVTATWRIRP